MTRKIDIPPGDDHSQTKYEIMREHLDQANQYADPNFYEYMKIKALIDIAESLDMIYERLALISGHY